MLTIPSHLSLLPKETLSLKCILKNFLPDELEDFQHALLNCYLVDLKKQTKFYKVIFHYCCIYEVFMLQFSFL